MTADENLRSELKRRTRFTHLVHVATCESTQDLASQDHGAGSGGPSQAPCDTVYWSDHQQRGRGRQQRVWDDEAGLDLAITLRVTARLPKPLALPAALPIAILQACEPFAMQRLRVKWPNDVYAGDRKLSGVLIDRDTNRPDTYRIGIGVNANRTRFPVELQDSATSLRKLSGQAVDRGELLLALAEHVEAVVRAIERDALTDHETMFSERLELVGLPVVVQARETLRGTLTAINFDRLMLDGGIEVPLAIVRSLLPASP